MTYIKRRGIVISLPIFIISIVIIVLMILWSDWVNQSRTIKQKGIDIEIISVKSDTIILICFFIILLVFVWYSIGKLFAPPVGLFITKFVLTGVGSQPFLEFNVIKNKISWQKFFSRFFNLSLSLFAIDFFVSNNFYYGNAIVIDTVDNTIIPSLDGLFIALIIATILEPTIWLLEDIGLRSYNRGDDEVRAVSSILDKLLFRFIRTGSLIASFATITFNTEIIDSIDIFIRIIFVRAVFASILICFIFTIFFQPIAKQKSWKSKNVPVGKSSVKLYKKIVVLD